MISIENEDILFNEKETTKIITLDIFSYEILIRKSAQLEAIKNMALQKEVLDGDAVLAICGVMKESE